MRPRGLRSVRRAEPQPALASALTLALSRAAVLGRLTRAAVLEALFATEVTDGVLGSFTFNENGDPAGAEGAVVGISVYRAGTVLAPGEEEVLLSMADHLVVPEALRAMIDAPAGRNQLLVDPRIEQVFDLDDATKVWVDACRNTRIGKELAK